LEARGSEPADPVVVFAGRHIPEKRVPALVSAVAWARRVWPELRCDIYGDGPERPTVERAVRDLRLERVVRVHGFVDAEVVDMALRRALCMALPSRREGYGLVVIEAASRGTPSVVVDDPDNAATELVEDGVNGVLAPSASAADLGAAILRVRKAGDPLRESTARWFAANARRLSLESSLEAVLAHYTSAAR
jgi:glycosyltransferase involved in cell wall biosynthesis